MAMATIWIAIVWIVVAFWLLCLFFTGFVRSHLDEPHRDCFGTKFSSKIMT